MALLHKGASIVSNRLPKVLGPGHHAIVDYSVAALLFAAGALFWRHHKSAALSAVLCGAGTVLNAMFTDYPGGVVPAMSFETHGRIDVGLAGIAAAIPGMMGFDDDAQSRFFEATAVTGSLASGFTDYSDESKKEQKRWYRDFIA